jgi:signal transduction histidine kinase
MKETSLSQINQISIISSTKLSYHSEDDIKSDLLGAVTHELRSPISAIVHLVGFVEDRLKKMGMSYALHREVFDDLDYIKSLGQDSLDLMIDVLEMRKIGQIGAKRFPVNLSEEINVKDVVQRAIKLNYSYYLRKGLNIKTEIADDLLLRADAKRLRQLLANLISNSVKYSPKGTVINISAGFDEAGRTYIKIIDQGCGIASEKLINIFNHNKEGANHQDPDSFGIGLPLVKELVEMQRGEISISSEVGKGVEVLIKF